MKYCRIQIFGRVQGVAFRHYTKMKADKLGLFGTTENQKDGSVITHVKGNPEKIDLFIEWCRIGSPASKVDEVIISKIEMHESREYQDFSVLR